jgi:hypothetical protein
MELRILAYEAFDWCAIRKLPVIITSIIRPRIPGVSKSDTHAQGRAVDISVKGWSVDQCLEFQDYMNHNFGEQYGAISLTDGKPRACVYHGGTALHHHLQVKRNN